MNIQTRLGPSYGGIDNAGTDYRSAGVSNRGTAHSDGRGVVTPATIRTSMPAVRDLEYELLKRFQTELFRAMSRSKAAGQYQTEFQVYDPDQDDYLLDTVFQKLIAVLRNEKFYVACSTSTARLFIVSWDPILTRDSLTQAELNDPNSNASIRLRRYEWLKKREELKANELAIKQHYDSYQRIASRLEHSAPTTPTKSTFANPLRQRAMQSPSQQQTLMSWSAPHYRAEKPNFGDNDQSEDRGDDQIRVDEAVTMRSRVLRNLIDIATDDNEFLGAESHRFDDDDDVYEKSFIDDETLQMMQNADAVAGAHEQIDNAAQPDKP